MKHGSIEPLNRIRMMLLLKRYVPPPSNNAVLPTSSRELRVLKRKSPARKENSATSVAVALTRLIGTSAKFPLPRIASILTYGKGNESSVSFAPRTKPSFVEVMISPNVAEGQPREFLS